jgi:hypothetical protein
MVVAVTASNGKATKTEPSNLSDPVQAADAGVGLGDLPGSLIAPGRCAKLMSSRGTISARLKGIGPVVVRLGASAAVTAASPLSVTTKVRARQARSVEYRLDGRLLARSRRAPFRASIKPGLLKPGKIQKLTTRVTGRSGKGAKPMLMTLRSGTCSALYTASEGVLDYILRVDSPTPMSEVRFTLPRALVPDLPRTGPSRRIGSLEVVTRADRSRSLALMVGGATPHGVLLAKAAGSAPAPTLSLTGTTLTVTGLPAGTGRVKLVVSLAKASRPRRGVPQRRHTVTLHALLLGDPASAPTAVKALVPMRY